MPNHPTVKNLGLAGLESTLEALAYALREHHPTELHEFGPVEAVQVAMLGQQG